MIRIIHGVAHCEVLMKFNLRTFFMRSFKSMSSKYTTTNLPIHDRKTFVITLVKMLGVFDIPKGITNHS